MLGYTIPTEDKVKLLGPIFLVVGLLLLIGVVPRVLTVRGLGEMDATTRSVDGSCGASTGGFVEIEVDGQRYQCTTGGKCGHSGEEVSYDSTDPSQCRVTSHVGGLGPYENVALAGSLGFTLVGGVITYFVVLGYRRRQRLMKDIATKDDQ